MLDRRDFLLSSVALAAASPLSAQKEKKAMPIIDTHQHLWDLKKFRLPWLQKDGKLDRSYVMSDYLDAIKGLNVVQAVYMEVDVDPKQQQAEADELIAICKKADTPTRAAVVSGRPASDDFARYVKQFRDSPFIKGIRQVLHGKDTPAGYCLDRKFVAGIKLLGDLGLRFDLCMRPGEMLDAAKLIGQCKNTRFVLDHCGNADLKKHDQWKKDVAAVAKHNNVVCKISGIVAQATPGKWKADDLAPVIDHALDTFGPDRVMFASDWPVCTLAASLAEWVAALKQIVSRRKQEDQKKLFHDNAVKFYGLKVEG